MNEDKLTTIKIINKKTKKLVSFVIRCDFGNRFNFLATSEIPPSTPEDEIEREDKEYWIGYLFICQDRMAIDLIEPYKVKVECEQT